MYNEGVLAKKEFFSNVIFFRMMLYLLLMSLMLYSGESFSTSSYRLCSVCLLDHCRTLQ